MERFKIRSFVFSWIILSQTYESVADPCKEKCIEVKMSLQLSAEKWMYLLFSSYDLKKSEEGFQKVQECLGPMEPSLKVTFQPKEVTITKISEELQVSYKSTFLK